mgnify:CR=1 FL=1|jgi:muramoyltetrapeptide carboxypeptidase
MLLAPPYLKNGDKVMLLSTARKLNPTLVVDTVKNLNHWGLEVVLGESTTAEHKQFAGNDALRMRDFQKALNNPDIKAIFCGRGGYGTVRIIDQLDFSAFLKNPKWIVGFSDVTYLHSLLNNQLYVQSLHAAMPSTYATTDAEAIEAIRKALFGEPFEYPIINNPNNRKGVMEGAVIGGNLSILYSITGTRSGFDSAGKILFIEDLDEYLYHIDRMLINLKRSGKLDKLAGLLVGGMSDLKDHDIPFGLTVEEMVLEHCAERNFPILFDFPAGHIAQNWPVVLGKKMRLTVA